jgi:hypothetical protein
MAVIPLVENTPDIVTNYQQTAKSQFDLLDAVSSAPIKKGGFAGRA